jgi:hypothetical protein
MPDANARQSERGRALRHCGKQVPHREPWKESAEVLPGRGRVAREEETPQIIAGRPFHLAAVDLRLRALLLFALALPLHPSTVIRLGCLHSGFGVGNAQLGDALCIPLVCIPHGAPLDVNLIPNLLDPHSGAHRDAPVPYKARDPLGENTKPNFFAD